MDNDSTAVLDEVVYPESDGKPMADNTLQWDWIVKIVGEQAILAERKALEETERADRLALKLRELGVNPDELLKPPGTT